MTDEGNLPTTVGTDVVVLANQLVELEKGKLEIEQQKIAVENKLLDTNARADDNQFTYHMERLKVNERILENKSKRFFYTLWVMLMISVIVVIFFVYMIFFGSEAQSDIALTALSYVATAVAGYGIFQAFFGFFSKNNQE